MPDSTQTFRNVVLPLASVLETIATAKASKGRFVGTSAQQAMKGLDEQKRHEEHLREKALQRAAQDETRGLQKQILKSKIGEAEQKKEKEGLIKETAQGIQRPLNEYEDLLFKSGQFDKLLESRKPETRSPRDLLTMFELEDRLKEMRKTTEEKEAEEERQAKFKHQLLLKYPKPEKPKEDKQIGEGTLKELAGIKDSINMLDGVMASASELGLWFNPGDKLRALNPWDVDANTFQQHIQTTKQVIGKGLEGGVLRKEDEVKYEKIIPRLGDTKQVLINKANTLRSMLANKYSTTVKFLESGERDVSSLPQIEQKEIKFGPTATEKKLIKAAQEGNKKAQKYLNSEGIKWQK